MRSREPGSVRAGAVTTISSGFQFTEGPVWRADTGTLVFSDIPASRQYSWSDSGGLTVFRDPSHKANGSTLDREGRLVTCEHLTHRVVRFEGDAIVTLAETFDGEELNSPNDVIVDSAGRIYFTDPSFGRIEERMGSLRPVPQSVNAVYRIELDGSVTRLIDDLGQPNGLCLSADERQLFVNDTATDRVHRYDVDDIGSGTVWAQITGKGAGSVDGMKFDSAGNLWVTGPGGIHVLDAQADLLDVVPVPEAVGNFTWMDDDLLTLAICASTGLYRCRVSIPGIPL